MFELIIIIILAVLVWVGISSGRSASGPTASELEARARRGNAEAQYQLGLLYALGEELPGDMTEVMRQRRSAERERAMEHADLGFIYDPGNPEDDLEAQFHLGHMYDETSEQAYEYDIDADALALYWLREAAKQGHAKAQNFLGYQYFLDGMVPEDEALHWLRMAAEQGYALAQNNLGFMYYQGKGVPEDMFEAVRWFRLAAEQGLARAQKNLGVMYSNGEGVPEDPVRAYAWYNMAEAQGDDEAKKGKAELARRMTPAQIRKARKTTPKS